MPKLLRDNGLLWPTMFTLSGLAVFIGLGTWQMQRKAWKEELIQTIQERSAGEPLAPEAWLKLQCQRADRAGLAASCDYTPVRLRGRFDHANERHVFAGSPRQPSGVGGPGYWIFTPFWLPDHKRGIFVNRGFVPHDRKDAATRAEGQLAGEVEIVGLVRTAQVRGLFDGRNNEAGNIWYVRDPTEFLQATHATVPFGLDQTTTGGPPDPRAFYIDQVAPVPTGGLPFPQAPTIELPNRHFEYAITWYSLAATLAGVYLAFARSRLKGLKSAALG